MAQGSKFQAPLIRSSRRLPPEAILLGWYVTYGLLWAVPAALMTLVCGSAWPETPQMWAGWL